MKAGEQVIPGVEIYVGEFAVRRVRLVKSPVPGEGAQLEVVGFGDTFRSKPVTRDQVQAARDGLDRLLKELG